MIRALSLVLICSLSGSHLAFSEPTGIQTRYMGKVSCGTWPAELDVTDVRKAVPLNFVLGIIVGKSFESNKSLMEHVDIPSVSLWMDNYCRDNPLDTIVTGALELSNELEARVSIAQD